MSRRSTTDLIGSCLRGEPGAWDEFVERYARLVYSIPRRYHLSEEDAADVFQNVFLVTYQKLGQLEQHERLTAWLITTAHRESWRIGRKGAQTAELPEIIEDVGSPSEQQLMHWEQQHQVRSAMDELGDPCRELLTALFLEPAEVSYANIADRMGTSVGSIGPTRARCFKKLEAILVRRGFG